MQVLNPSAPLCTKRPSDLLAAWTSLWRWSLGHAMKSRMTFNLLDSTLSCAQWIGLLACSGQMMGHFSGKHLLSFSQHNHYVKFRGHMGETRFSLPGWSPDCKQVQRKHATTIRQEGSGGWTNSSSGHRCPPSTKTIGWNSSSQAAKMWHVWTMPLADFAFGWYGKSAPYLVRVCKGGQAWVVSSGLNKE